MSTNRSDPHALEAFLVNLKGTVVVGLITRKRRLKANDGSPCPVVLSLQGARDGALGGDSPTLETEAGLSVLCIISGDIKSAWCQTLLLYLAGIYFSSMVFYFSRSFASQVSATPV